ncbi:hypothetical protein RSAG8_07262, partial [Rhizoctonia solani AG-8 WAC10335]
MYSIVSSLGACPQQGGDVLRVVDGIGRIVGLEGGGQRWLLGWLLHDGRVTSGVKWQLRLDSSKPSNLYLEEQS